MCVCKCPCGSNGRYRQPIRPRSYAPVLCYSKPADPISCHTTYRKSYLPTGAERACPIIPPCNLELPKAQFARDTINKMSYPGWKGCRPPEPIMPCTHQLMGEGPMKEITTTRHDYVPKPFVKSDPIRPANNIYTNNQPISDKTINRLSYRPVQIYDRAEPILPKNLMECPQGPISSLTIQKCSYQPVPLPCKDDMPWANKPAYQPPTQRMAGDTIYKKSYQPNCGMVKTVPIVPPSQINPLTCSHAFEDTTIYHASYMGNCGMQRPPQIIPPNNLCVSTDRISGDTINRMSYKPNYGFRPPEPTLPCTHQLMGEGPMQEITTTRHDYVPKPICPVMPLKPVTTMCSSMEPLSDKTINRLSYRPNCSFDMAKPIIPPNSLCRPEGRMECATIQKISYQPVTGYTKADMPWAAKPAYQPPTTRMACDTIYNMSFEAPGEYIGEDCSCRCAYDQAPIQPQPCLKPIFA